MKVNFARIDLTSCGFWDNHTSMWKMLFLLLFLRNMRECSRSLYSKNALGTSFRLWLVLSTALGEHACNSDWRCPEKLHQSLKEMPELGVKYLCLFWSHRKWNKTLSTFVICSSSSFLRFTIGPVVMFLCLFLQLQFATICVISLAINNVRISVLNHKNLTGSSRWNEDVIDLGEGFPRAVEQTYWWWLCLFFFVRRETSGISQ